jgi:membrane-associated phospholipid phosphatase
VAMSRMYRGMHHPLDVASGVLIGIGAIAVLLFACRSASCAHRSPAAERTPARAGRTRTA